MKLLLDTLIALWAIADDPKLSSHARELIATPRNLVRVSAVSIWEIAIEHSLGRGDMPISDVNALEFSRQSGYRMLPVSPEHAAAVESLPAHHNDQFDRLLVIQSLTEPLRLPHDVNVARYSDTVILV